MEKVFIKISVSAVTVWLRGDKKDKIIVQTKAPSPERSNSKENFSIQFEIAAGKGQAYVEKWFNVEPLVINEKTSQIIQNFATETEGIQPVIIKDTTSPEIREQIEKVNVGEEGIQKKQEEAADRNTFFYQPKAEDINAWKAVIYSNKYFSIYGMDKNEWFPFLSKATREEVLFWFQSKGKSYGEQVLTDAINAE